MIKINFHRILMPYTNTRNHTVDIQDFTSFISYLRVSYPNLIAYLQKLTVGHSVDTIVMLDQNKKLITENQLARGTFPKELKEIWLVPSIVGGGKGGGTILLGLAIAAFAYFALPAMLGAASFGSLSGFAAIAGKALLGIGINIALSGLLQSFLDKPKKADTPPDEDTRRNNDSFDGLKNTTDTNQTVQLVYGRMRVAGQLITGYVKTIEHDKNVTVRVGDYV